jgi:subtilisin-like proprotein convertase family protein
MKRSRFLAWFPALLLALLFLGCDGGGRSVYTYYSSDTPVPIPDEGSNYSDIFVTGAPTYVSKVTVTVVIVHTWVQDLDLILESPEGTSIYLTDNDSSGEDFWYTTFDDDAPVSIMSTSYLDDPRTGYYSPNGALGFFIGELANGLWTLTVDDELAEDFGYLLEWSIDIR